MNKIEKNAFNKGFKYLLKNIKYGDVFYKDEKLARKDLTLILYDEALIDYRSYFFAVEIKDKNGKKRNIFEKNKYGVLLGNWRIPKISEMNDYSIYKYLIVQKMNYLYEIWETCAGYNYSQITENIAKKQAKNSSTKLIRLENEGKIILDF